MNGVIVSSDNISPSSVTAKAFLKYSLRKPIRQEDADGAQGYPTCSQFIARKKLLPARPLARFRIA